MKALARILLVLTALLGAAGCGTRAPEGDACLVGQGASAPTEATAREQLRPEVVPVLAAWLDRQDEGWRLRGGRRPPRGLHLVLRTAQAGETHLEVVGNTIWRRDRFKLLDAGEMAELWSIIGPRQRVTHLRSEVWAM